MENMADLHGHDHALYSVELDESSYLILILLFLRIIFGLILFIL